ncbi:MAG TPA: polysaccharide biosynthesis tyrosine autokinase [Gemmatimonadales bacterium]|nr:polysaccharide biosynthesis tyrosine autokinase [Gemmatimonadales bacterium]
MSTEDSAPHPDHIPDAVPEPAATEPRRLQKPRTMVLPAPPAGNVALDYAAHAFAEAGGGGLNWRHIAMAVLRFKWMVGAVAVLGTLLGVIASQGLDSTYEARATLWVDVPDVRARDQGPIQSGQLVGASGWVDLLQSHVVLDDVVRELRLYLSLTTRADTAALATFQVKDRVRPGTYRLTADAGGRFALLGDDGAAVGVGALGDSVGADLGMAWVPPAGAVRPGRAIEFSVTSVAAAAGRLAAVMRVHTDLLEGKVGNFMSVELRGSDPVHIAAIVNAIAERFVAVAADLRRQKLVELVRILGDQVRYAQGNLAQAEQALRQFRVGAITVLSGGGASLLSGGGRDPASSEFFDMKVSREQLRRDRRALERVLAQMPDSGVSVDALETSPAVQHSSALMQGLKELTEKQAMLRALRYRYTEQHPPVRRLAGEIATLERHTIPALVRGLIAQLTAREAELSRNVDSVAGGLRQIPPLAIQEARLQRDVAIAEQLFANIQQRFEEARLAEVSSIPEVRILDRADPPHAPLFNAAPALVALAFMGSLVLAIVGAVVLDRVDSRVRYPDQVTGAMGLTILGAVPHVSRRNGGDKGVGPVIEALRGLRLRMVHAHGEAGPILVTITSPGKGDGKSFVAANLALAFAEAGYRTLLIDGDIRQGSLHRMLRVSRKPGLTELLAGTAPRGQVIQATGYPTLWFLGGGSRTQSGPELLSTAPMARLITSLRPGYDVILVDSPPLAAGADAYALGTLTGALLLVLRTGYSNRQLAQANVDVLARLPIRVLGAVLNDVRLGGAYDYYSYYLSGYEVGDEEPNWKGRPVLRAPD